MYAAVSSSEELVDHQEVGDDVHGWKENVKKSKYHNPNIEVRGRLRKNLFHLNLDAKAHTTVLSCLA